MDNEKLDSPVEEDQESGNLAMADAMRRVLSIGKHSSKSSIVLAKAKVLTKKTTPRPQCAGFQIEKNGNFEEAEIKEDIDAKDIKPDRVSLKSKRIKKQEIAALGRSKPAPLDREKERPLVKIATRGVIQLFNAVREQQKFINKKIEEVGSSERKREKVLKSIDKKAFLDVLRGCTETKETRVSPEVEVKTEDEDGSDNQPSWQVLRDDFMMGAKLKDWDKKEAEETPEVAPKKRKHK